LTSWTRQDLQTATVRIAQYQSSPGHAHFKALRRMATYLCHTFDRGLVFKRYVRSTPMLLNVAAITSILGNITMKASIAPALGDHIGMSADGSADSRVNVYGVSVEASSKGAVEESQHEGVRHLRDQHRISTPKKTVVPVTMIPPPTDGDMDANHGSVFETVGFTGVLFMMIGTLIASISQKQATIAYNTAESELYAATDASKLAKWIRIWMLDIGLPYSGPIAVGEDNNACRLIAHGGKLTRNVRHIAIQTAALQQTIQEELIAMYGKPSQDNRADFFTKLLGAILFWEHSDHFMGVRFLTQKHREAIRQRNLQSSTTSKIGSNAPSSTKDTGTGDDK